MKAKGTLLKYRTVYKHMQEYDAEHRVGFIAVGPEVAARGIVVGFAVDRHAFGRTVHEQDDGIHRT